MKTKGKREVETYNHGESSFVEFPCKKHPTSPSNSTGGICAYCLTERLYEIICPNCGEHRLSSCSCFDLIPSSNNNNRNSTSSSVGSVGRISFLLENDKVANNNNVDVSSLKRSNTTCVGGDTSSNQWRSQDFVQRKESSKEKFWKIGRLFRKKRDKTNNNNDNNNNKCNGVSRSRSLCSFKGFYDNEDYYQSGNFPNSSSTNARASSVSTSNYFIDSAKRSCFSESEARISNFDYIDANGFNKNYNISNIFSLKESEFMSCDDPSYIDLKLNNNNNNNNDDHMSLDHQNNNKGVDLGALRRSGLNMSTKEFSFRGNNDHNLRHEMFRNGSCRRSSVTERELRKCRKSYKVWRWFFRHQTSSRENVEDHHLHYHHGFNS